MAVDNPETAAPLEVERPVTENVEIPPVDDQPAAAEDEDGRE